MSEKYTGTIQSVDTYYGIIRFDEERFSEKIERKIPFFIAPTDTYVVGDEIEFEITTQTEGDVRGSRVQYAININRIRASEEPNKTSTSMDFYQTINSRITPTPNITDEITLTRFLKGNHLRYSSLNEMSVFFEILQTPLTVDEFKAIQIYDQLWRTFILKWVLNIENNVKNRIEKRFDDANIDFSAVLGSIFSNNSYRNLKNIMQSSIKKIKKKYMLRDAGRRLNFQVNGNADIPTINEAPLDMIQDEFTVGDLMGFIDYLRNEIGDFSNDTENDWQKIYFYLSEIKHIRNIAAHGNSFLSAILDKKNNPNYLLETNASLLGEDQFYLDDSKSYSISELIRSAIRLSVKGKIPNPLHFSLYIRQMLVNNQTMRSFFYLYYGIHYLFRDTKYVDEFRTELGAMFGENIKTVNLDVITQLYTKPNSKHTIEPGTMEDLLYRTRMLLDYLDEEQFEMNSESEVAFLVKYQDKEVLIDLDENADWVSRPLLNAIKNSPKISGDELRTTTECERLKEYVGFLLYPESNARKILIDIFGRHAISTTKDIKALPILEKVDTFTLLEFVFLGALSPFSKILN